MERERRHVIVEWDGRIAIVRLNRPPVNALELNIVTEAEATFDELAETDVGAVIFTGAGECFSAGLDLKAVPGYGPEEQRRMITSVNRFLGRLYGYPRPVVAAVNGHAIAGGFVVILACDYRVGPASACKLGLTEARAGIPFPAAAMAVLQAELTPAAARVLTLVARNMRPQSAREHGILDELQPAGEVLARALGVARDLAQIPSGTYARIKRQLRAAVLARLDDLVSRGTDPMLGGWLDAEAATGAAAILRGEAGT